MSEYFTTRELATLLRIKERKVYDLVAADSLPVRRVTGKLLFPRKEIEAWIAASGNRETDAAKGAKPRHDPMVMAGGHDPLLEWALRESRSGIAAWLDGALDGLQRFQAAQCLAAALHIPEGDGWNVSAVKEAVGNEAVVLIEWAKRSRGLMYRPAIGRSISCFSDLRDLRFQARQPEAASELILAGLLEKEGLARTDLQLVDSVERSETDLGIAVSADRADVGLGLEAVARQFHLEFLPLVVERFDLLVWRKAFFDPPFQKLIGFCSSEAFRSRARSLGGYDCSGLGTVHFNGP